MLENYIKAGSPIFTFQYNTPTFFFATFKLSYMHFGKPTMRASGHWRNQHSKVPKWLTTNNIILNKQTIWGGITTSKISLDNVEILEDTVKQNNMLRLSAYCEFWVNAICTLCMQHAYPPMQQTKMTWVQTSEITTFHNKGYF